MIPTWFNERGTIGKNDGWYASMPPVYIHDEFRSLFIVFKVNFDVIYFIGFKKRFCPVAVRTILSGVHYDL